MHEKRNAPIINMETLFNQPEIFVYLLGKIYLSRIGIFIRNELIVLTR